MTQSFCSYINLYFYCNLLWLLDVRANAKLSLGMSSVIVDPAAIKAPSPTVTGAIKFVLQPMKASFQ